MGREPEKVERNKKMVKMYVNDGMTMQEIGDVFSVSRERVRQILERYGITRRKNNRFEHRAMKLYEFLIEYKKEHDGNTPIWRDMMELPGMFTQYRVNSSLSVLEALDLIAIGKTEHGSMRRTHIKIIGAKWIPPGE